MCYAYVTFVSLCKRDTSRVSKACKIMFFVATVRERGFSGSIDIWGGYLFGEGSYAGRVGNRGG
jgi:hypothetical protein